AVELRADLARQLPQAPVHRAPRLEDDALALQAPRGLEEMVAALLRAEAPDVGDGEDRALDMTIDARQRVHAVADHARFVRGLLAEGGGEAARDELRRAHD